MTSPEPISQALEELGKVLREQPSFKEKIMQRITERSTVAQNVPFAWYRSRTVQRSITVAACLLMMFGLWQILGTESANQVYADALEHLRQARTFSCLRSWESIEDGKKFVEKERFLFKEPYLERVERIASRVAAAREEVMIHDYQNRQRLQIDPVNKVAFLFDYRNDYVIEEQSGNLKLRELDTSMRERLLKWSQGEVKDRGKVELNGQTVQLLESTWGKWDQSIWVDLKSKHPVQVVMKHKQGSVITFSSIQIDEELDDQLFSLDAPEGYELKQNRGWPKYQNQLNAKMSHLALACHSYRSEHDNQYPMQLSDLTSDDLSEQVLKNILADPNQPGGESVIQYYQPSTDADSAETIMMHQKFDKWPEAGGIVACYVDGHRSIIGDQEQFEKGLPKRTP